MQSVLIVVHLMIVVALVVVVLLQRSEGGALGVGGGGGFMTGRGQANALTRATAILAALFFATSLSLTILARLNQASEEVTFQSITPVGSDKKEESGKGGLLEQLQRMQDQSSQPPALPQGMTLPGESEAGSQPGQSILETRPAEPEGSLPLPKLPATPAIPPAQTGPSAPPPASPLKVAPPASAPPWAQ